jgi:uncharacterized protein YjbI with pentapeptide repeats
MANLSKANFSGAKLFEVFLAYADVGGNDASVPEVVFASPTGSLSKKVGHAEKISWHESTFLRCFERGSKFKANRKKK